MWRSMLRTGIRLLRRKPRDREERTMPVLFGLTHRRLTYKIFTEKAGEKRGCCDPTQALLTSLGQKGCSPHPREIKGVGASRIDSQMMLEGANGTGLEDPSKFLRGSLLTGCLLSAPPPAPTLGAGPWTTQPMVPAPGSPVSLSNP